MADQQPTDSPTFNNLNAIFVTILTIIVLVGLWQIRGIIMLALAGMMLAILLSIPLRFFMRWGLNRIVSIVLSFTLGVLVVTLLSFLLVPTLINQFSVLLTSTIPSGLNQLFEYWNSGELYQQIPGLENLLDYLELDTVVLDTELVNQVIDQVTQAINRFSGSVLPLLGGVASVLLSTFIVLFVCIYIIIEPNTYTRGIISLTPLWYRDRMQTILSRIDETIRAWIRVTAVCMLFIGVSTGIGLALVGVEQWLALGVLAGLLSFVPNFGMVLTLVPAVAVTIVQAPNAIFIVIAIIVIVSFAQAQIIGPYLTSETMNLPPVLILIGQIILGVFFGFLGLMLAVPLTAIVVVLVQEIYVKDILGDELSSAKNIE
ncbi:MAG: AI-2E family transporter [Chloroflexota bacterium]